MKKYFWLMILVPAFAHADIWDGNMSITQKYACMGIDKVPISHGTAAASECCSGGQLKTNAAKTCISGFSNISANSSEDAGNAFQMINNLLNLNDDLNQGIKMNTENTLTENTPNGGQSVESSASTGAKDGGKVIGKGGYAKKGGSNSNGQQSGDSALSSGGAGSGRGSMFGLSDSDREKNGKKSSNGSNSDSGSNSGDDSGVRYTSANTEKKGAGDDNADGVAVGDSLKSDLDFSGSNEADAKGALGLNGGDGSDGDVDGSGLGKGMTDDPSDYFSRIDKSASIFKVVSARYMKKKSLWNQPQKLHDELKQKKI